jgi:hypothetical protein
LHDAPTEALLPGASNHFQYLNNLRHVQQGPQSPTYPLAPNVGDVYGQQRPVNNLPVYNQPTTSGQLPLTDALLNSAAYATQPQPSVVSQYSTPGPQQSGMQSLVQTMETGAPDGPIQDFAGNLFDTPDLSQYNFDPASFNFGNHYGALEFGILGQMATGAAETPPSDTTSQINQATGMNLNGPHSATYPEASGGPYIFTQDQNIGEWRPPTQPQSNVRHQHRPLNLFTQNGLKQEPNAFSIAAGSAFASPTSELSPQAPKGIEDTPTKLLFGSTSAPNSRPSTQGRMAPQSHHLQSSGLHSLNSSNRRRGDPSAVYKSVTQPYSYTTGFHSLIAFIQKRFSSQKTLRIAKALASIRPSFLACTRSLGHEDLIFMEKCFQRTLWEYEDFINACGTPTIVCRRTGEVAAVGKEFSILTGWKKDVLLGREPNLNVNGSNNSNSGSSNRGVISTPRLPEGAIDSSRRQPVFLAELLDDDSVIEFYEDFARLAFGDSRGGVTTRCKLLRYRTQDDESLNSLNMGDDLKVGLKRKRPIPKSGSGAAGEAGIDELGDKDGKVECSCCWTVKRDLFDLPMM